MTEAQKNEVTCLGLCGNEASTVTFELDSPVYPSLLPMGQSKFSLGGTSTSPNLCWILLELLGQDWSLQLSLLFPVFPGAPPAQPPSYPPTVVPGAEEVVHREEEGC